MRKTGVFITVLLVSSFFVFLSVQADGVGGGASIVGKKNLFSEYFSNENGKLPQIGAVTFIKTPDKKTERRYRFCPRLYIVGTNSLKKGPIRIYARKFKNNIWSKELSEYTYVSPYGRPVIDGRDHSLRGNILRSSEGGFANKIFGVEANTKKIEIRHVTVIPHKRGFDSNLDISKVIAYLKKNADVKITKDTECNEDGCVFDDGKKAGYSLGTKEKPKIVVVDKARLALKKNFKGYGVLILTGERNKVPVLGFPDEVRKIKCKITEKTLTYLLEKTRERFHWVLPNRARKSLRLTMDDSASWYGVIISDVSSLTIALGRQTYHQYIPIYKPYKPILKDEYKRLKKNSREPLSFWNFIGNTAYARGLKKEMIPAQPFLEKPELPGKEIKKPESPKKKIKMPQIGRVKIYGAVLLKGRYAAIKMNSADILYSSEAINLVDNMISSLPFTWEEYKEEE